MDIGNSIKRLRKQKALQQKSLATLCEVTQTYFSLIENNKKRPSLELLEKIGLNLGIPTSVILFLSLSEDDVADNKKDIFRMLNPSITNYIEQIFMDK